MSRIMRVSNRGAEGWTGAAIQRAVDRAAGCIVEVPAGEYLMHDALHLRNGIRLVGEKGTVLRKVPSISSRIVDYLGYGHYEITVEEPRKFRVGMGIHILDDNAVGFYTTVATVVGIDGERLFLDRLLNHDYGPAANARAVSVFSLIEANAVVGASVEQICLDGDSDAEKIALNGCRGGGVFIYQSRHITLRDLEICNYRGDSVSFQQNIDIEVSDCHIHHNAGGGIHPGSGSVRYLLRGNRIHDNDGCGIFYCLRTTHSICCDNLIERNGGAGISIGERDTDHIVSGNSIGDNGGPGIHFRTPTRRSGDRVRMQGNRISGNCRRNGAAEIEISPGLRQLHITGNVLMPGTAPAISVGRDCAGIYIEGNTICNRPQASHDIRGARTAVVFTRPTRFPALGPRALPRDGARHLGVNDPGPCRLPAMT